MHTRCQLLDPHAQARCAWAHRWQPADRIFARSLEARGPGERFTLLLVDIGPEAVRVLNASPDGQLNGFSTLKLAPEATPLASVIFTVI